MFNSTLSQSQEDTVDSFLFPCIQEIFQRPDTDINTKKQKAFQIIRKNVNYPDKLQRLKDAVQNMNESSEPDDLIYSAGSILSEIQHHLNGSYKAN